MTPKQRAAKERMLEGWDETVLPVRADSGVGHPAYTPQDHWEAWANKPDTATQPAIPPGWTLVNSGTLQMVINALRRDAAEGKVVRGEMADALTVAYDAKNGITGETK